MWATLVRFILRIMKQIGFQKVYEWQTAIGQVSTSFTTSPITNTTKQTSSTTATAYSTTVSTPYTTFVTTFSTDYSRSTSTTTTTTWATSRNTTYVVNTNATTSTTESAAAVRSTNYSTSRNTAYTSSWTYAYSTTGSGTRSTGYSASRSTSYSASRSTSYSASRSTAFTDSRNTSFTTSWNYTANTAYSESGSRATNYQTNRYTESGGGFGGGMFCVVEGSLVHINATDTVPIESLQVGDQVYSKDGGFNTDDENLMHTFASNTIVGQPQQATITEVYQGTSSDVISINNGLFRATKDHFMIVKQEDSNASVAWRIRPLYICLVGDYFMDVNGNEVEITSIDELTEEFNVWKIDTEPADVFYANGILTHNSVPINNP
mgnify:CR=1 FL=1